MKNESLTKKDIEQLLREQTLTILSAVDEKITRLEKRLIQSETRTNAKLDQLTTTLDKFLKRMTDMEDEFTIMKHDLNRVKMVLKEKLGIDLL